MSESRRMFSPQRRDVILQGSIDGVFSVVDALAKHRIAGPLSLQKALAFARQYGAPSIFQQSVDGRGRLLGDPSRLETS